MPEEQTTVYERIGGASAVDQLVDDFYVRVLSDQQLRPFFENSSVDRLKAMQKEFFAAALDGPVSSTSINLAQIHKGRGITRRHLTRFVNHLIAVLEQHSHIESRDKMDIIFRIATWSDDIIDDAGGTDG
jgi:hemoglobin